MKVRDELNLCASNLIEDIAYRNMIIKARYIPMFETRWLHYTMLSHNKYLINFHIHHNIPANLSLRGFFAEFISLIGTPGYRYSKSIIFVLIYWSMFLTPSMRPRLMAFWGSIIPALNIFSSIPSLLSWIVKVIRFSWWNVRFCCWWFPLWVRAQFNRYNFWPIFSFLAWFLHRDWTWLCLFPRIQTRALHHTFQQIYDTKACSKLHQHRQSSKNCLDRYRNTGVTLHTWSKNKIRSAETLIFNKSYDWDAE